MATRLLSLLLAIASYTPTIAARSSFLNVSVLNTICARRPSRFVFSAFFHAFFYAFFSAFFYAFSSRPSSRPSLRYVESMRRLGEWGGEIEIGACAQMLNRPVEVYGRWLERKCHLCRLYRLYRFCVHSHSSSPLRLGSPLRQAFLPPGRFDLLQRMSVRNNESLLDVTLEAWEILGEAWERLWREEPDRAKLVFPFFLSPFLPF